MEGAGRMSAPILCLACGEEMNEWHNEIYECNECGNMIDSEIFDDEELNE